MTKGTSKRSELDRKGHSFHTWSLEGRIDAVIDRKAKVAAQARGYCDRLGHRHGATTRAAPGWIVTGSRSTRLTSGHNGAQPGDCHGHEDDPDPLQTRANAFGRPLRTRGIVARCWGAAGEAGSPDATGLSARAPL